MRRPKTWRYICPLCGRSLRACYRAYAASNPYIGGLYLIRSAARPLPKSLVRQERARVLHKRSQGEMGARHIDHSCLGLSTRMARLVREMIVACHEGADNLLGDRENCPRNLWVRQMKKHSPRPQIMPRYIPQRLPRIEVPSQWHPILLTALHLHQRRMNSGEVPAGPPPQPHL